jgi:zinc/manganese transport system substrate-binding protein
VPSLALSLPAALAKTDPAHAADYQARLAAFLSSLRPIDDRVAAIRKKFGGAPVTASEPVFGYMAGALGLAMRNERFQLSIMNDTEPAAHDVAAFERDLKEHRVRAMFYNKQASDKIVQHLVDIARAANVPVVGVTELVPAGMTFQDWMLSELADTEKALAGPNS